MKFHDPPVCSFIGLSFGLVGLEHAVRSASHHFGITSDWISQVFPFLTLASLLICFGYVSRRFERQADVYAARTMEGINAPQGSAHVGPIGARIFNDALLRVMEVNNMPLGARGKFAGSLRDRVGFAIEWFASLAGSWLHGTMLSRMRYINRDQP